MSYIDIKQVSLQDGDNIQINPAQDETVVLLRKLLHISSSLATTDVNQRQRVVVESSSTVPQVTNIATFAGVDLRFQFADAARNVFANAIRPNLIFS